MKAQDIVFFNKEGRPHNLLWDANRNCWTGKIMFDHNGSDTYKTLGMYLFERVAPVTLEREFAVGGVQHFVTGGRTHKGGPVLSVDTVTKVNDSPDFFTKWFNAPNAHQLVKPGDMVQFGGNDADFPALANGAPSLHAVLDVRKDEMLIWAGPHNGTFVDRVNADLTIKAVNAISFNASSDYWNVPVAQHDVNPNDRVTLVGTSKNDGTYNISGKACQRQQGQYILREADAALVKGGKLELDVVLRDDLPTVYSGTVRFEGNSGTATSRMFLSYALSPLLQVGDQFNCPLLVEYSPYISAISADRKEIELDGPIDDNAEGLQSDVRLRLTSNAFTVSVDVLGFAGPNPMIPQTLQYLASQNSGMFSSYGIDISFAGGALTLRNKYYEDTFDVTAYSVVGNVRTPLTGTNVPQQVYLYAFSQEFDEEVIPNLSSAYRRVVEFVPNPVGADAIDSVGLTVTVNGRTFFVDSDDDDDSTLHDWMTDHAAAVGKLGVTVTRQTLPNGHALVFEAQYPNVPVVMGLYLGDTSDYRVRHSSVRVKEVNGSRLVIRVNGRDYVQGLSSTDPGDALAQWVLTHKSALRAFGVLVESDGDELKFYTLDPQKRVTVDVFNKIPRVQGDTSVVYTADRAEQVTGVVISCNKLTAPEADFVGLGLSTGQVVAISGAEQHTMNIQYAVVGVEEGELTLSYQGAFWPDPNQALVLTSADFLREPRHGSTDSNSNPRIKFDWRETQTPAMFFYDFSGQQLKGYDRYLEWVADSSSDTFAVWLEKNVPYTERRNLQDEAYYVGPRPLLGGDALAPNVRLNTVQNADPKLAASPLHQQTIFADLTHELYYTDDERDITVSPEPLQVFVGYRSLDEGVDTARLYVTLEVDRSVSLTPTVHDASNDDEFVFDADGTVTVEHATDINFVAAGFEPGQLVTFSGEDVTDYKRRAHLENNGRTYEILTVKPQQLTVLVSEDNPMVAERSVKLVPPQGAPYYHPNGQPITLARTINVKVTQAPTAIAELDILGQTEVEDPRFKLALDNIGRNIRPKDLFIFSEYDINEAGVDWTILNRKRKELLQVQSEIYNYVSSYKSVTNAIDFFGYNDLAFIEYYVNLDGNSDKFGKLFSSELIDLFNKLVPGFKRKNRAADRLPNDKYKKTNLFSLSYKITDDQGNFASGYNFDEVTTKLFGLQQWLEDNVVPMGSRIVDITGHATSVGQYVARHNTFMTSVYRAKDGFSPAVGKVSGHLMPIQYTTGEGTPASPTVVHAATYNIAVDVKTQSGELPETVCVRVRTFNAERWNTDTVYKANDQVVHAGKIWYTPNGVRTFGLEPGVTADWLLQDVWKMSTVQALDMTLYEQLPINFTVNKELDPHFLVQVISSNAYGATWSETKSYSVDYGVWG